MKISDKRKSTTEQPASDVSFIMKTRENVWERDKKKYLS